MEFILSLFSIVKYFLLTSLIYVIFSAFSEFFLNTIKLKVDGINKIYIYPILGSLLFGALSFILMYLRLEILVLPISIIALIYLFKQGSIRKLNLKIKFNTDFFILLAIAIVFSLNMVTLGIYGTNIYFRSEDPVHLAYINELISHFPPENPGFSGVPLKGYHFFYQFIIASLSKTFFISIYTLYFNVLPFIISTSWVFGAYGVMMFWFKNRISALIASFLSVFGGGFGFILLLYGHKNISIDSVFGINQPASALINPQFAYSVPVIFTALYFILGYLRNKKNNYLFPVILCTGLLPLTKIYGGIVLYSMFGSLILIEIFNRKFKIIFLFLTSVLITFLTFGQFLGKGQGLIYYPLWPSHTVLNSNLPWYGYEEKSYTYSRLGVIRGIIEIESFGLMIYFIGNIGIRIIGIIIGLIVFIIKRRLPSIFCILLIIGTATSVLIPLFFIQTGKVFESIQFAWYYPIFCSFFAGAGIGYLLNLRYSNFLKTIILITLFAISIPTVVDHYNNCLVKRNSIVGYSLKNSYFKTMEFISQTGNYDDIVLEVPPAIYAGNIKDWFFKSSPHITAFGNKQTYLNYEFILFDNIKPETRFGLLQKVLNFSNHTYYTNNDRLELINNLKNEKISYIISQEKLKGLEVARITKILFHNSYGYVYKII